MSAGTLLKYGYLAYLSRPVADRVLYRAIRKSRPTAIVEIGIDSGTRTRRILDLMHVFQPTAELVYTGIDLFEARPAGSTGLSLKQTHALLKSLPAKVRLVPGDPFSALSRTANTLLKTDLLIMSAGYDAESLSRAWFYVPRMLHENSCVFLQGRDAKTGRPAFELVPRSQIDQLAEQQRSARRAA